MAKWEYGMMMVPAGEKTGSIQADELDEALAELIRQGRVELVKDAEGRDVYRLVRN
jgi:hypothetical protein